MKRLLVCGCVLAAGCRAPAPVVTQEGSPRGPVVAEAEPIPGPWARRTLAGLSLEARAAQLVGVRAFGLHRHPRSEESRELMRLVGELGVGVIVVFDSEVGSLPRVLNELQQAAATPLLVAADMERGLAFRVQRGVVPLPYAMAIGATRSEAAARFAGEVAAREGRALGIHWAFAPVADVNNNPANPVINIRSFGEEPALVAELSAAFIGGAGRGGLLTTAKHFPGHGDTAVDSHLALPRVDVDRARLDDVELLPFRRALEAGVDAVMVGHVAAPALDPSGAPATFSWPITGGVLREELGFGGIVVTDALEMGGVGETWSGDGAVQALLAGADVVLLPPDPDVAVQAIARAVRDGRLSEAQLNRSVLRLLALRERLGLHAQRLTNPEAWPESVDRPEDRERALEVARASITVVRNRDGLLPLATERPLRLLHLVLSSDVRNPWIRGIPEDELERRRVEVETLSLGPEVADETSDRLVARAGDFTHVVVSAFARVTGSKGTADMTPSLARLVRRLQDEGGRPVVVVSFGSPYLLRQFPAVAAYVCAYGGAESSQRAAISAIFGEHPVGGRLPVTLPGLASFGDGERLPRREMTLRRARPEDVGFRPGALDAIDGLMERFVASGAFPGGVVAVGRRGALVKLHPFGRLAWEGAAPAVSEDTLYDLSSLTKVVATTAMAMVLVDEGRLELDQKVSSFLPAFTGRGREDVTVRHLLAHASGLDWWAPLYEEVEGREAFGRRLLAMDLVYPPGSKSLYSDLGFFVLGEVLERAAGEDLESFVRRRVFEPLGMSETRFRPPRAWWFRVAPTEECPWRGRVLRGEVHDENAFALGGVAPNAGLFSTAGDVARFAQTMLNGGVLEHQRLFSRALVEEFTRRVDVPGSTRALGWDTRSSPSSSGRYFSDRSYGHLGFTGTSLWIDPERELFVVLLTNRVHPSRDNLGIREARPALADAVVEALEGGVGEVEP